MQFLEKKEENGFIYTVEDSFGEMEFRSPVNLDAVMLDQVFLAVFNLKEKGNTITGTIKGTGITYIYKRKDQWSDVEEEEVPILITDKENFIIRLIKNLLRKILLWLEK